MAEEGRAKEGEIPPLAYAAQMSDGRGWLARWWRPMSGRNFILVLAAAVLCVVLWARIKGSRERARAAHDLVKSQVAAGGSLNNAINMRRLAMGQYPAALSELTTMPAGVHDLLPTDPQALRDPWNNPYQYRSPGVHNASWFDLWSMGADGVSGTGDDIGNW